LTTTSSRDIAFRVLVQNRDDGKHVAELLEQFSNEATRDDLRLASEIAFTTLRRRETLDTIIAAHVKRPPEQVERDLWMMLRIGTCQIVLLETPTHAAVHETVETAKRCGNRRWTGFLNGTLRAIVRTSDKSKEPATEPAATNVPLRDGSFRVMDKPVFPNPTEDITAYIRTAYSFPGWLVERWLSRASVDEVVEWARWFNAPPRLTLRANTILSNRDALIQMMEKHGIAATPGVHDDAVILPKRYAIPSLPGFDEGAFAVQDESAMAASNLLAPKPGERILDLCAGSGSKTCHLAALMNNEGSVVAVDTNSGRLERLHENANRLGVSIVETQLADVTDSAELPDNIDAVLVDVPCSNSGVLGKRPEVRWRLRPEELTELSELQNQMLNTAVDATKVGGRIVYSTCSCEPEENALLVAEFLTQRDGVSLVSEQHHLPGQPGDGAYQALLTRDA
jgi:16S rRNA (cytosine967-C5)-methyltransferase